MKKIWISIFLLIFCSSLYSQENDFQIWSSFALSDRITYKTDVTVKFGSRFRENGYLLYKSYNDIKLRYKYNRNISLGCGYRSIKVWDNHFSFENRNRYYSDLYLKNKYNRFTFYLRNRCQKQGNLEGYLYTFRQEWSFKYNIRNNKINPLFAFEYFYNEIHKINKFRYTFGFSSPFLKSLDLSLSYRIQQDYSVKNADNIFILSTKISYKF